jgi:hypothetical protein
LLARSFTGVSLALAAGRSERTVATHGLGPSKGFLWGLKAAAKNAASQKLDGRGRGQQTRQRECKRKDGKECR